MRLTKYQSEVWKQIKAGAIIRKFRKWNGLEAWRFLTSNNSVIGFCRDSCVRKLIKHSRVIQSHQGYVLNPNWHGNNSKNKS